MDCCSVVLAMVYECMWMAAVPYSSQSEGVLVALVMVSERVRMDAAVRNFYYLSAVD